MELVKIACDLNLESVGFAANEGGAACRCGASVAGAEVDEGLDLSSASNCTLELS